jgi:urease gamma subunit
VDGWTIALIVGGILLVLLLALTAMVVSAAARVGRQVNEVMVALEEVRSKTEVLAELERMGDATVPDGAAGSLPDGEEGGGQAVP